MPNDIFLKAVNLLLIPAFPFIKKPLFWFMKKDKCKVGWCWALQFSGTTGGSVKIKEVVFQLLTRLRSIPLDFVCWLPRCSKWDPSIGKSRNWSWPNPTTFFADIYYFSVDPVHADPNELHSGKYAERRLLYWHIFFCWVTGNMRPNKETDTNLFLPFFSFQFCQ